MDPTDLYASKQGSLIAANVALMCLSIGAVGLRLLARRIAKAGIWWGDYVILLALLFAIGTCVCNLVAVHYDFGKHVKVARPDAVPKWYEVLYFFENFYAPCIALTKISILLFYRRLFPQKDFQKYIYAAGILVCLWWVSMQLTVIFECTPVNYFWTHEGEGHCINIQQFFLGQAIPNIITDFILLALPLPLIYALQLPTRQKIGLMGIFLLGSFVIFASIYRLVLLFQLTQVDITWNYADAAIWSAVEPCIAVVSACLPMLRPLVRLFSQTITSTGKESSGGVDSTNLGSSHQWSKNQNTINDDASFTRLQEAPAEIDHWGNIHAYEPSTTNIQTSSPSESGADSIPLDAIRVKNEVR